MTMTNIVMEWRESLDSAVVRSGAMCMTLDQRFPHPWDDDEVVEYYRVDDGKVVVLADGGAGSEWGKYAIMSDETRSNTWVVVPDLPERYARDER